MQSAALLVANLAVVVLLASWNRAASRKNVLETPFSAGSEEVLWVRKGASHQEASAAETSRWSIALLAISATVLAITGDWQDRPTMSLIVIAISVVIPFLVSSGRSKRIGFYQGQVVVEGSANGLSLYPKTALLGQVMLTGIHVFWLNGNELLEAKHQLERRAVSLIGSNGLYPWNHFGSAVLLAAALACFCYQLL